MKKLIFALVMLLSITISAQSKIQKAAKKTTNQMTKVMSLDAEQSSDVLAIQLENKKNIAAAKKEHQGNEAALKAKVKDINGNTYEKMRNAVGDENLKKWRTFKKKNKKKKD